MPFCWSHKEIAIDGHEIGEARNMAAQAAKDAKAELLCFIDWDVLMPPRALHTLVYHAANNPDVDVFSAVYCVKMDPPAPLIYKRYGGGVFWDWTPGDILCEGIVGCGMGMAVIRMSVFDKLEHTNDKPWFRTTQTIDADTNTQQYSTEDTWFLHRVCEEIGPNRILIDTGILCAHIDNHTGSQYVLPENSIPGKRLKKLLAK
jgi:hypothetical protein